MMQRSVLILNICINSNPISIFPSPARRVGNVPLSQNFLLLWLEGAFLSISIDVSPVSSENSAKVYQFNPDVIVFTV
ncbi:hypothetical protein [Nitrosomonas sp.]|uniref:hypothetical protein n=1 Tax=Nitrosomonas sp. TaxID=42353 RepID=UPI001DFA2E07|nr:hypothetical protein [Nitrosomonas sp.]MCB1949498.1 hypothetical protein [Nitrosomonas sp.]